MTKVITGTLEVPGAVLTYDVHEPETPGEHPPLFIFGSPMAASDFEQLVSHFTDRTVITYDPRGAERSTLTPEGTVTGELHGEDMHRVVEAAGLGPVDAFGSSGGAAFALHWIVEFPQDVRTLVAHEPPLLSVLPDAERAFAAERRVQQQYAAHGWGAGMAMFIAFTSVRGEVPEDFGAQAPDPAMFGLPTQDDGSRDYPLLSGVSDDVTAYRPDLAALRAAPTRVVVAAGIESKDLVTWRASEALAAALGTELTVFPSHHGGFVGPGFGQPGQPEAFAARLREVLGDAAGD